VVSTIADRIPVTILTGFLGSGKTTLLRKLLAAEGMQRTAVVINEFGEIGLDHLLVKGMTGTTVVLQNGCICCTIRSDVQQGFRELVDGRSTGEIPPFDRIVLETTGLADPVPIVQTLTADAMLRHQTRLSNIITTVDAVHGSAQLREHPESLRQTATADRIVVTKSDLANARDVELLNRKLAVLNPTARRFDPTRSRSRSRLSYSTTPFIPSPGPTRSDAGSRPCLLPHTTTRLGPRVPIRAMTTESSASSSVPSGGLIGQSLPYGCRRFFIATASKSFVSKDCWMCRARPDP